MDLIEAKWFTESEKRVGSIYPPPGMILSLVTEIERLQARIRELEAPIAPPGSSLFQ